MANPSNLEETNRIMNYRTYLDIGDTIDALSVAILKDAPIPSAIVGNQLPGSLEGLTYGQLLDLQSATSTDHTLLMEALSSLFGVKGDVLVLEEDVKAVYGFLRFIVQQLEKVTKAFKSIERRPSPEEMEAGVQELSLGAVGLLDWYAKRQGLTSFRETLAVKWIDIWSVMRIDAKNAVFKKDLETIYQRKNKR